jgi:hypothetical protein
MLFRGREFVFARGDRWNMRLRRFYCREVRASAAREDKRSAKNRSDSR